MKIYRTLFVILLITFLLMACSTGGNQNQNSKNQNSDNSNSLANSTKDDIEELELNVKLPFHPEEAVWREETLGKSSTNRLPGPTDKKLVAVLRFTKEDADKVVEQAKKYNPGMADVINTESWFPAELIAQSQTSGDETIKGTSYAANDFFNTPYTDGKITRIEGTDYFILELWAR